MELAILLITVFVLLIIGAPVTVALGVGSLIFILMEGTPSVVVLHRMVSGVDSFPLIAVPFFILAGHLMNSAGITTRIFGFAKALVGWMHGGLGHVNIGASIIFAGMSGAAVADAGGLGTIEIKAMRDAGYDDDFAVAVTAAIINARPKVERQPAAAPAPVVRGAEVRLGVGEADVVAGHDVVADGHDRVPAGEAQHRLEALRQRGISLGPHVGDDDGLVGHFVRREGRFQDALLGQDAVRVSGAIPLDVLQCLIQPI